MGTTTPIRGLYKPAVGEVGWGTQVDANWDNLDATADKTYVDTQDAATLASAKSYTDTQVATGVNWNELQNATAALTLANGTNPTIFNHTSAATWTWANTTLATSSVPQASPSIVLSSQYWNGSASATDTWTISTTLAAGTNGQSQLSIVHAGSTSTNLLFNLGPGIQGSLTINIGSFTMLQFIANTSSANCSLNAGTTATPFAVYGNSTTAGREALALGGPAQGGTSGTMYCVTVGSPSGLNNASCNFGPTSGTSAFQAFTVRPTLNQTGGANGTMTSIMVNAVETAIVGTHNFIDLQGGAAGTSSKFTIKNSGVITNYNAEATAAVGAAYIRGSTLQKNETGADASLLSVTPAAAAGRYRISISMCVSAASAATLGWTVTYKDSNGTAQAPTNMALNKLGTAAPATTFSAAANDNYSADAYIDVDNSGTAIVIKTTFAGTSIAYKASATIERIA